MLERLRTYCRFVKIEHSIFALPLLLAGLVIVFPKGTPIQIWCKAIFAILLGGFGARTAAFSLNRIIDQRIDAKNPRTLNRELPNGKMTMVEAIGVGKIGALIYFIVSYWILGLTGVCLAIFPLVVFSIYPFMKRFTCLAHFGVGFADALAPTAGWIVAFSLVPIYWGGPMIGSRMVSPEVVVASEPSILALVLFTFLWVSGFDIIYATLDEEFDRQQGLYSMPARFGRKKALWISATLHAAAFVTLCVLYVTYYRTPVAGVLLSATGVLLFWEQYCAENVDLAFFKINGIIGFLILAFVWTGVAHL